MAQSLARDEAGNIWDVSNPKAPRFVSAGQSPIHSAFASPTLPFQGPQAQADLTGKGLSNTKDQATLPYDIQKAQNEATKSGIDAKTAQVDLNMKTGTPPGDLSKTGGEYISSLPSGVRDLTQEMLNGNFKGSITSSRNPVVMQAALAAAHATNGNFDAGKYDERLALIKNIASDPNSPLNALNTALAHAGVLYDQAPSVAGGTPFGHTPLSTGVNAVENWWNGSSPAVRTYEGTVGKYGPEQAKAYNIGTGGERGSIEEQYSPNLPLDTKRALLANDAKLYAGKIAAIAHSYDMIGGNNPLDYLSPDAKEALQKIDPQTYQKLFATSAGNNQQQAPFPGVGGNGPTPPSGPSGSSGNPSPVTPVDFSGDFNPNPAQGLATMDPNSPYGVFAPSYRRVENTKADSAISAFVRNGVPYSDYAQYALSTGHAPAPQDQYNKVVAFAKAHPNAAVNVQTYDNVPTTLGQRIASSPGGSFGAAAAGAGTAGLLDVAGRNLAGPQWDQNRQALASLNPVANFAGDVAGTATSAFGINRGLKAGAEALQSAPVIGKVARGLVNNPGIRGFVGNELYGGTYGASENPDHPLLGAAIGAGTAAAGDLAGRYAVAPLARSVAGKGGGMFGYRPPVALNSGESAIVNPLTKGNTLSDVQQKLSDAANLKLPYSLADADPRLTALAGNAVRKSPDVMALARTTLPARQYGQAERALSGINDYLAPPGDLKTILSTAKMNAQEAAEPFYQQAYDAPAPNDAKLNEVLNTPDGAEAVRRAYSIALNRGESPADLSFSVDSSGEPIINASPNYKTLHYTKMGLDSLVEDKRDPITGTLNLDDPWTQSVDMLRNNFRGRLGELNPAYAKANQVYADAISQGSAAESGYGATAPKVTPTQAQLGFNNQPEANAPLFQQGFASNMADTVNNTRFTADPMGRIYGSPAQQAKVASIFPNGAQDFGRMAQLENDMSRTNNYVIGNSLTPERAESDKMFDNIELGNAAAKGIMTGGASIPFDVAELGSRKGLGWWKNRMSLDKANAIGPFLLNQDPSAANAAINDLIAKNAAYRRYLTATGNAGGMFGASMALPFIQPGQ